MTLLRRVLKILAADRSKPASVKAAPPVQPAAASPTAGENPGARVHADIGHSLLRAGRLAEAVGHFHAALKIDPEHPGALAALGRAAEIVWDVPAATRWLEAAATQPSSTAEITLNLARLLRETGRFEEAERALARLLPAGDGAESPPDLEWERALLDIAAGRHQTGNERMRACIDAGTNLRDIFLAARFFCRQAMFDTADAILDDNRAFILERLDAWSEFAKFEAAIKLARKVDDANATRTQSEPETAIIPVRALNPLAARETSDLAGCLDRSGGPVAHSFPSGIPPIDGYRPGDLDGILAADVDALCRNPIFADQGKGRHGHRLYVLPDVRLSADTGDTASVVIEPGFYLSGRMNEIDPVNLLNRVAMKPADRKLPAAFVLPSWPANFYHTLCCSMGTLAIYRSLGLDLPIVLPRAPDDLQRAILGAIDLPADRILIADDLATTLVETAFVPQSMPYHWNRPLIDFHRSIAPRLAAGATTPDAAPSSRVYISRRVAERRRLVNEDAIEDIAGSFGFRVLRMEELSFADQVAAVRDAEIIIGPHGAGLAHMIFCQPGTTIVELMPDRNIKADFCLRARSCGHVYYPVIGHMPPNQKSLDSRDVTWTLDPKRLATILERLVA